MRAENALSGNIPDRPQTVPRGLFLTSWRRLAPLAWLAYVVVPTLVTLILVPINDFSNWSAVRFEWVCNLIGAASLGVPLHLACWWLSDRNSGESSSSGSNAPQTVPRNSRWKLSRRLMTTAGLLVFCTLLGAELSLPFERPRHSGMNPTAYRLQFYRLGLTFAAVWLVTMWTYDAALFRQAQASARQRVAEARTRMAQLEALQIKTDPHFLYNALNTVAALIELDPGRAVTATEQLSELFREVVDVASEPLNTLRSEVDICKRYVSLQQLRFDEGTVTFDVAERAREAQVPALMLQPLIENAVKHGRNVGGTQHWASVRARAEEGMLRLTVESPTGPAGPAHRTGVGIPHLRERLELLYGEDASLNAKTNGDSHVVTILIPWESAQCTS